MEQVNDFIAKARAKNLPETTIKGALIDAGWSETMVNQALTAGIEIPRPPQASQKPSADNRPTLGSLQAALLHVLLWFFTAASTVAIGGVSSSLFGGSVSSEALASMIAVAVITFTPYAIFFISYLRRARKTAGLIPSRVWSIITICIHSIGAMVAGITLVVGLITGSSPSVTLGATLIALLNIIVLTNYAMASFAKPSKIRRASLTLHLVALALLLGGLFTVSLMRLAPAQADSETKDRLVESVEEVANFSLREGRLPTKGELTLPNDIDYSPTSNQTYKVCATFNLSTHDSDRFARQHTINDSYVSIYDFSRYDSGENCFDIQASNIKAADLPELSPGVNFGL